MSGIKPSFLTGANAKIKAGGTTIAYAQDVSYNVTVTTIPIETMGRYEVVTNEPVAYFVDGTLSVIRYSSVAAGLPGTSTAGEGNDVSKWPLETGGATAGQHVNPGALLESTTWDLEIFQKSQAAAAVSTTSIIKAIDCRFTRMGGAVNKRGVLVEQFSFNARLLNDGDLISSQSGDTDLSV